jgi:hypothetical protein
MEVYPTETKARLPFGFGGCRFEKEERTGGGVKNTGGG